MCLWHAAPYFDSRGRDILEMWACGSCVMWHRCKHYSMRRVDVSTIRCVACLFNVSCATCLFNVPHVYSMCRMSKVNSEKHQVQRVSAGYQAIDQLAVNCWLITSASLTDYQPISPITNLYHHPIHFERDYLAAYDCGAAYARELEWVEVDEMPMGVSWSRWDAYGRGLERVGVDERFSVGVSWSELQWVGVDEREIERDWVSWSEREIEWVGVSWSRWDVGVTWSRWECLGVSWSRWECLALMCKVHIPYPLSSILYHLFA